MESITESAVTEPPTLHLLAKPEQVSLSASNEAYWRGATKETLRQMLDFARYDPKTREQCIALHEQLVCPHMGPAPVQNALAKGCLTSNGTPIEYSFSFGSRRDAPVVRYSIDPDGTSGLGAWAAPNAQAVEKALQATPGVDMGWYIIIRESMHLKVNASAFGDLVKKAGHNSQIMFGFDFEHHGEVNAKAYFLPCLAAAERGLTRWEVVRRAVEDLVAVTGGEMAGVLSQLYMLRDHLLSYLTPMGESVRFLATDLVRPEEARLKIYIRCPSQEFEQVWAFMTMNGKIPYSEEHRLAIKALYEATVQTPTGDACATSTTTTTDAFRKRSICYFVLKQGALIPSSKLFIRMDRKTAGSDIRTARTLQRWLSPDGKGTEYEDFLQSAFSSHDLDGDVGAHAWLAVSVKKGKLTLESYLVPKLFE